MRSATRNKLLFVRHGESEANVNGMTAGALDDSPLTEKGRDDARLTAEHLSQMMQDEALQINRIISSPLVRALETAQIITHLALDDAKITTDNRWIERDVGAATGIPLAKYFELEKAGHKFLDAESPAEMAQRIRSALDEIRQMPGTTLVVSHNGVYRILKCILDDLPPEHFAYIEGLKNGEIFEVDFQS